MKKSSKRSLNDELNKRIAHANRKEYLQIVVYFIVATVLLGMLPILNYNFGDTHTTTGQVETLGAISSDTGEKLYLVVRLENGQLVRVPIPRSTFYHKGRNVQLAVKEPLLFGNNRFRFLEYVD